MKILVLSIGKSNTPETWVDAGISTGVHVFTASWEDISYSESWMVKDLYLNEFDGVVIGPVGKNLEVFELVVSYLDEISIPYFLYGCPKYRNNKFFDTLLFKKIGVPFIPSRVISSQISEDLLATYTSGFSETSVVIKPISSSQGKGVVLLANSPSKILEYLQDLDGFFILQPYYENQGDYRILILENEVLGVMKRVSQDDQEFRNNASLGGVTSASELPPEILEQCILTSQASGLSVIGIDLFYREDTQEFRFIETNSAPQFAAFQKTFHIDIPKLILQSLLKKIKHY
jgi:hypothetical protein